MGHRFECLEVYDAIRHVRIERHQFASDLQKRQEYGRHCQVLLGSGGIVHVQTMCKGAMQ